MSSASDTPKNDASSLSVLNESPAPQRLLTDSQAELLAKAQIVKWTVEAYEFAYNTNIKSLVAYKRIAEYAGYALAVIFLFFQYVAKENWPTLHAILSYTGLGLGIVTVLIGIWGHLDKWDEQIDKKKELAIRCREFVTKHYALTLKLPPDEAAIRKWMIDCQAFEGERQHVHGSVGDYFYRMAHRHIGNTYPDSGVKCKKCNRTWSHEMNRAIARLPWGYCSSCGVNYDKRDD